ncbi:MAG: Nif3-like dinuclear metal center hexameric protein [Chitinophagaceae bacterium]|nr:Nif3-like dinuclear metal center hexameric protein [Chitinophagaceae bacterium]MCW5905852.1 Nif3-like dinuclear metal center hexameric protein [Chitinophagaceae bacterium]
MKIKEVISKLEELAPPSLQENYDNAGLLTGNNHWQCTGIVCSLDVTEAVVLDAIEKKCNLIVAHHPIIFGGLKKINGNNYVEKTIIAAIKNDIAIYAIHTNLDNVLHGVNKKIADKLGLINTQPLLPKENMLQKLYTFVPTAYAEKLRTALFAVGAGHIGNYSECSFNTKGAGTFKAEENTHPFVGKKGQRHEEEEIKIEVIFPNWLQKNILTALKKVHPYEEPAYDIIPLNNVYAATGSGLIGELPKPVEEKTFFKKVKRAFDLQVIKHTKWLNKPIQKVAICGGAGSFLIKKATAAGADLYLTADIKYHEFFDANDNLIVADIGHYESEQYTIELLLDFLQKKFPNFAVLKSKVNTNPVNYFL